MKPQDFDYLRDMLKTRSGLVLSSDKAYLVESRLMPVARKHGLNGLDDLVTQLRRPDKALEHEIVDAMTTNESFFFRDNTPFESFKTTILPLLFASRKAAGKSRIRIWCAACSSGQEPYSLAMLLDEDAAKFPGLQVEILATDLSTEMIAKANKGEYSQFEVQRGLPVQLLVKYFQKDGDVWRIADRLKKNIQFREFNLLDGYGSLGTFDIIYCRNVLIYFDQTAKRDVLDRLAKVIAPDGALYLGGAESVLGLTDAFKPVSGLRGVYAPTAGADADSSVKKAV